MKIIIAAEIFTPDIGGPATYSLNLAKELVKQKHDVTLICYSDRKHYDEQDFKVERILRSKISLLHYGKYFKKLLKSARSCDVIYAMGPVASGMPAMQVAKKLKKKLVVKVVGDYAWEQARNTQVTDLSIDEFQATDFDGKIGKLKEIEKKVCQAADFIITPSNYLKNIVVGWGVNSDKIKVVYNSFSGEIIKGKRDPNLIVSVGRLVPWKGFDTLIKSMPELLDFNKDFRLKIFGTGPQKDVLENLIKELKLEEKVEIISLQHDNLIDQLSNSGIFILNTGYEGLPHTVLEALATSTPVITTNVCGNPEVITNDENGMLIEYNNQDQIFGSIVRVFSDPSIQKRFIENGKKTLDKFTFKSMINNTVEILKL